MMGSLSWLDCSCSRSTWRILSTMPSRRAGSILYTSFREKYCLLSRVARVVSFYISSSLERSMILSGDSSGRRVVGLNLLSYCTPPSPLFYFVLMMLLLDFCRHSMVKLLLSTNIFVLSNFYSNLCCALSFLASIELNSNISFVARRPLDPALLPSFNRLSPSMRSIKLNPC